MPARILALLWLLLAFPAQAADITDATGRSVALPAHIQRVLPAGPPAATLLQALAPDLMLGWPSPVSDEARAFLSPEAARLPAVPRITGREDVIDKAMALKPDLILDYGAIAERYVRLARATQEKTGVPTILLDGAIGKIPQTIRLLGDVLGRSERARVLAAFAEALLALPATRTGSPRVMYARGPDGLTTIIPGGDLSEVFVQVGWQPVAPAGDGADQGPFRRSTVAAVKALDPDIIIFADPGMRQVIAKDPAWQQVRAVQQGRAVIAPGLPFGWVEEPPSINRLAGVAWLRGHDATLLATTFNAVMYGRPLTPPQLGALLAGVKSPEP